jgi:hypothetical protein
MGYASFGGTKRQLCLFPTCYPPLVYEQLARSAVETRPVQGIVYPQEKPSIGSFLPRSRHSLDVSVTADTVGIGDSQTTIE